jgi:hypothetical protein
VFPPLDQPMFDSFMRLNVLLFPLGILVRSTELLRGRGSMNSLGT